MIGAEREAGGDAEVLEGVADDEADDGERHDPLQAVAEAAVHKGKGEQNAEVQHRERRGSILDADQLLDGEKHDQKPK